MAYCPSCGAPVADDDLFCRRCGRTLGFDGAQGDGFGDAGDAGGFAAAAGTAGEYSAGTWSAGPDPAAAGPAAGGSAAGGAAPEKRQKKSCLPRVGCFILVFAVIAFLALYVVPLFIPHPFDPNSRLSGPGEQTQDSDDSTVSVSPIVPDGDEGPGDASSSTDSPGSKDSPSSSDPSSPKDSPSSSDSSSPKDSSSSSDSSSSKNSPGSKDSPSASDPSGDAGFSTSELPLLSDFSWITGETAKGNMPAGATRLTDLSAVTGGWKGYLFDSDMEWLLNATIDIGQSGAVVSLDWYYIREGATGNTYEDTSDTSVFSGSWDFGMLEASGPGRVTISTFWQQDGRQFAAGSLMWPDGTVSTLMLVRP